VLHRDGARWHWIDDSYPANAINLRSVADGNFVVVDRTNGKQTIIAEVDFSSAALTLYEGAIYMVQSVPWQVEKLDWVGRKAYVTRTHVDYYTDAIDYTRLKPLASLARRSRARRSTASACGAARVRLQEDPLLQPREHRLRTGQPAGSGTADHLGLVATVAAGDRPRVPHPF
jgi:ATP-dependent helicase YprA (DUF1998 family)